MGLKLFAFAITRVPEQQVPSKHTEPLSSGPYVYQVEEAPKAKSIACPVLQVAISEALLCMDESADCVIPFQLQAWRSLSCGSVPIGEEYGGE